MFHLFGCKHQRVASKFLRTPRYDQEALIEYSYCEDCKKLLRCKVTLVPVFSYPPRPPKVVKPAPVQAPAPAPVAVKPVAPQMPEVKSRLATGPIVKQTPKTVAPVKAPKPVEKPILPGDTFIKANKKKRNVGRKPSAPTAPAGSTVGNLVKSVYERAGDQTQKPLKVSIQDDLDKTYSKFEDDDEGDNDLQVVRRESPEDAERRFRRAKRREQRKG